VSSGAMNPNWRRVSLFYVATFALTYALSLGYVLTGGSWGSPSSFAVANVLMLCPAMVAMGLQRRAFREPVVASLGLHFRPSRWFLLSWLFPPLVMIAALAISLLLPGARYSPDMAGLPAEMNSFKQQVFGMGQPPIAGMLIIGLVLGPTLNAMGGLGEEIGWRGLLYKELLPLGFWSCSLVTGVLWALWHVPPSWKATATVSIRWRAPWE
jgi:membrane protease YdiL (CAAX protease family)